MDKALVQALGNALILVGPYPTLNNLHAENKIQSVKTHLKTEIQRTVDQPGRYLHMIEKSPSLHWPHNHASPVPLLQALFCGEYPVIQPTEIISVLKTHHQLVILSISSGANCL
jgi:hypothetical protein